jgi:uroporphyrinogen III methyltransferase/synthase
MGALAGKRVLVTRAREQAHKSVAAIEARGAVAVLLPTIEIRPPSDLAPLERALGRSYDWALFTSPNGVKWAWRAFEALGKDARALGAAKVAAIGEGTAEDLAGRGVRVSVTASESRGEGLAAAMLAAMQPADSALLLRAQTARDVLPDTLRAAGHPVEVVAVYETHLADPAEAEAVASELARGAIDAVTFTSGSTVDGFVAVVGGDARAADLLGRTLVASIGPVTSEALAAHGLRADATAGAASVESLLDALEAHFAKRHPGI